MDRLWRSLVSLRTTAILLAIFAVLLLANVVFPQRAVDPGAHQAAVRSGAVAGFLLVTAGLGDVASSLPFLATLGALFLNLAAVLVDRLGATVRRVRFSPPTDAQLRAMLGDAACFDAPAPVSPEQAPGELARMGFRAIVVREGVVWGVKHRLALLGFPLFHASFFVLLLGGLQLYLTRDVVTLVGAEGETLDSRRGAVVRRAPSGEAGAFRLTVDRVDVRLADGKPVDLAATLVLDGEGAAVSRVNHPALWRELSVLVERAGIAPVFRLTDERGFTVDHVVVPTASPNGMPTRLVLAGGDAIEVAVDPIPLSAAFPVREALPRTPVALRLSRRGATVFDGKLRAGEAVTLGDRTLTLQEVRYYAGLRLVHERGGALLIAGFVLAVVGTVWRMFWYRREIAIAWEPHGLRVGGRCEFFPDRFRGELAEVARVLGADRGRGGGCA